MQDQRRPMVKPEAKPAYPDSYHIILAHAFQEASYPPLDVTEKKANIISGVPTFTAPYL